MKLNLMKPTARKIKQKIEFLKNLPLKIHQYN